MTHRSRPARMARLRRCETLVVENLFSSMSHVGRGSVSEPQTSPSPDRLGITQPMSAVVSGLSEILTAIEGVHQMAPTPSTSELVEAQRGLQQVATLHNRIDTAFSEAILRSGSGRPGTS